MAEGGCSSDLQSIICEQNILSAESLFTSKEKHITDKDDSQLQIAFASSH